jgi:hypothetical protein
MLDSYVKDLLSRKIQHEIHSSELHSFRGCRRRWNWIFRENLYPPVTAKPLEFGLFWHSFPRRNGDTLESFDLEV